MRYIRSEREPLEIDLDWQGTYVEFSGKPDAELIYGQWRASVPMAAYRYTAPTPWDAAFRAIEGFLDEPRKRVKKGAA